MEILVKVGQFLLSISLLVFLHELGHFTAAKVFKTRVEKFYIFFDPWFSLFKRKKGETEYGIGWLPLGGYVKISGMIDESMDKEQMKLPPKPYEFRSKPAWQRLIIMLAGVTVNVIFAALIYIGITMAWGDEYLSSENAKYGISVDELAYEMGLRNGDIITYIGDEKVDKFFDVTSMILLDNPETVTVIRNGNTQKINVPKNFIAKLVEHNDPRFILPRTPYDVGGFSEDSNAKSAGLKVDDRVIALNGNKLLFFDEYLEEIPKYKNQEIKLTVKRGNQQLDIMVPVSEAGKIGVYPVADLQRYFQITHKKYSFFGAIPRGLERANASIKSYFKQLKLIFSPETKAYKSVGGFITFGKIFPSVWDWQTFWNLTAFISIMLAVLNVLPIPALDGGHVMFLLYEIISGRKPGDKFMEYAQIVGMIILFSLLIFANGNDIYKLFQ